LIRATAAVLRREWQVQRRYPVSMVNTVLLTPLYQLALPTLLLGSAFVVNGRSFGLSKETGSGDLGGWIGTGVLAAALTVGAVTSVYNTLDADRVTGAIEHSWSTPASRHSYVVGAVLTGTLFGGAAGVILIGIAVVALGAVLDPLGVILSVPAVFAFVVGNCGFGYLVASALLAMRQADILVEVTTMVVVLFSGVMFPLTLLPGAARWPTYLLPGTWALDLVRYLTLETRPLAPPLVEAAAAVATALAWFGAGAMAFRAAERQQQVNGTLHQF
jgi:ABC-type multidrug transport system permease subunit